MVFLESLPDVDGIADELKDDDTVREVDDVCPAVEDIDVGVDVAVDADVDEEVVGGSFEIVVEVEVAVIVVDVEVLSAQSGPLRMLMSSTAMIVFSDNLPTIITYNDNALVQNT